MWRLRSFHATSLSIRPMPVRTSPRQRMVSAGCGWSNTVIRPNMILSARLRRGWPRMAALLPSEFSRLATVAVCAGCTANTCHDVGYGAGRRRPLDRFQSGIRSGAGGATVVVDAVLGRIRPIERDYTVFVHLTDENGQPVAQTDGQPGGGTRPTSGWQPGEAVRDSYAVPLAADMPPGVYTLQVGMYLWPGIDAPDIGRWQRCGRVGNGDDRRHGCAIR